MNTHITPRARRSAALVGLLGAAGLLVSAKEHVGPSSSVLTSAARPAVPPSAGSPASPTVTAGPPAAPSVSSSSPSAPATTTTPTTVGVRQITGSTENNPYGPIQVRITLSGGKLVEVTAVQSPTDHSLSVAIAQQALPILRQEVLQAQSARIDNVSGASYDSLGYAQSVQSALDKARAG